MNEGVLCYIAWTVHQGINSNQSYCETAYTLLEKVS